MGWVPWLKKGGKEKEREEKGGAEGEVSIDVDFVV